MKRKSKLAIAIAASGLAVAGAAAVYAQDEGASLEVAERNRVLRLQGIRGLGGGLFRPDSAKCSR